MIKLRYLQAKACGRIWRQEKGITFIELLIVIVIIAIAAMIAIPRMGSAGSVQVRAATDMIAADLEYAKSMATSRQSDYFVIFDTSADSYQIQDSSGVIDHPVKTGSQFIINFSIDSRLDQVNMTNVSFTDSKVRFDRMGSPDNAGTITLQGGGVTATITVEAVTGYITTSY